jgi:hypothetical protein
MLPFHLPSRPFTCLIVPAVPDVAHGVAGMDRGCT